MSFLPYIPEIPFALVLRSIAIAAALATAVFVLIAGAEAKRLHVDGRQIVSADLPAEFDGARIVFVADVHAGTNLRRSRMAALVDQVNALKPDILLLGGDYVGGRADGASIFYPEALRFRAALGKYAVLGNHDNWEGASQAREGLSEGGITLLENSSARVHKGDASIVIAGLEDLMTGYPDASAASEDISSSDFAVLLSHNPMAFPKQLPETAKRWGLALAGHTHGGQVTFFGLFAPIVPAELVGGYRAQTGLRSDVPVIVTNGVGTVTLPLRFFARAEIHVITLRCA